jgi:hypothetical protein
MAGIPPGSEELVLSILRSNAGPMRRRKILAELEVRGHRISLAGLNRILQYCSQKELLFDSPEGVRLRNSPAED